MGNGGSRTPLNPGTVTPDWDKAITSVGKVNSYVTTPIQTTNLLFAQTPSNSNWTEVYQKLVVAQNDEPLQQSVYILSIIPDWNPEEKPHKP